MLFQQLSVLGCIRTIYFHSGESLYCTVCYNRIIELNELVIQHWSCAVPAIYIGFGFGFFGLEEPRVGVSELEILISGMITSTNNWSHFEADKKSRHKHSSLYSSMYSSLFAI